MRPKVSVIIPIYNTAPYLQRCLDSVLQQQLKELEIILVDDESSDEAPAICDEYAAKDARIRVIHKKNGGLGFARNSGLEIATGQYVAFLDSDDYIASDYYERMYQMAVECGADTCVAGYQLLRRDGSTVEYMNPNAGCIYCGEEVRTGLLPLLLGAPPEASNDVVMGMSVWKALFSMDLLRKYEIKFCSERQFISEDAIFDIDYFAKAEKVVISPECGYFYCENGMSLSRKYQPTRYERCEILYLEELRRSKLLGVDMPLTCLCIQRSFIGNARYCMQQIYHNLKWKAAVTEIRRICESRVLADVIKTYPYKQNPISLRVFNKLMELKCAGILWILIAVKN